MLSCEQHVANRGELKIGVLPSRAHDPFWRVTRAAQKNVSNLVCHGATEDLELWDTMKLRELFYSRKRNGSQVSHGHTQGSLGNESGCSREAREDSQTDWRDSWGLRAVHTLLLPSRAG